MTIDTFKINTGIGKLISPRFAVSRKDEKDPPYFMLIVTALILFFVYILLFKYNQ